MFIVKPELDEEQVGTATDRVHQLVVANGGEVTKTAAWGKRRLAYQVGGLREGYYVVSNFNIEADKIVELERVLKISDTVFRHLLVRRDAPSVGQAEVYVPEATAEDLASMMEPTNEDFEDAPPAVVEDDEMEPPPAPAAPVTAASDETGAAQEETTDEPQ